MSAPEPTTVLTLRVPADLDRRISREARRARKTKSALLRDALLQAFADGPAPEDPAREARRQSLLVSRRGSEREAIDFIEHAADSRGWR
jgi:transcriptional regulator of met regulon